MAERVEWAARQETTDLPEFATPSGFVLRDWRPEEASFWETDGKRIATRNLWISIPNLLLGFAIWMVWSVVVAKLPLVGFDYTPNQLFWLAALPGLSGATLRIFYSFMVPIFGGRRWTALSTGSLLLPALWIGFAVQDPQTPYLVMLILALLCGLGGGNFSSSMANISFFFPKSAKGSAMGLNAGLGNLGVSAMQFLVPLVITAGVFGALGGAPRQTATGQLLWLQNAGFIWVPLIIIAALAAWFGMNDIASARSSIKDQLIIFTRKHTWLMSVLYTGTFGSFIGFAAAFPLLAGNLFPEVDVLRFAFLGPLVGALSRAFSGSLADRFGGARVSLWVFVAMALCVFGVLFFIDTRSFWGFFAMFLLLFFFSGVGNASTTQMIPAIFRQQTPLLNPGLSPAEQRLQSDKESAAAVGFISAVAAYGAFFIPKAYGSSIALSGSAAPALYGFTLFYGICIALTWFYYTRRNAEVPC
ncbi:NarK family nitrate/nitrite MFS transporter [Pseudomonas tumuqii]|uniref:NarK family nitrate/nitrite MFS transporter n=1 Tax=Pseudomonas tumuqii TaxID=2715755 RepID=UPI0036F2AA66